MVFLAAESPSGRFYRSENKNVNIKLPLMRLSKLQKFILERCRENKNKSCLKTEFYDFYPQKEIKENKIGVQVGIQKSIDNLVTKDFVIAYGHKTMKKWYVNKVRLTAQGRRKAKELIKSKQGKLPIK